MDEPVNLFHFLFINLEGFSLGNLVNFTVLLLLLACSALISGSEVAFFSLSPAELKKLNESKDKKEQLILTLLERSKNLLATILISNNFINVAIILLSTLIAQSLFEFTNLSFHFQSIDYTLNITSNAQEFTVNVILITFMILMTGEVVPKIYASRYPIFLAGIMARPLLILRTIFSKIGLVPLLVESTKFIDKRIKKKTKNISVDDLSNALEITKPAFEEEEGKILNGIVKFGNTDVKQIMTPRVDVIAIDTNTDSQTLVNSIVESGYSRIPVFEESFDNIKGILYIKDLLPFLNKNEEIDWVPLLRDPFYVPENKKIDDLLEEFQEKKIHLAIVVDEYGGSSGIVSLEDVIEEIVGDISDEFDEDSIVYSKLDDSNFVFEGKTPLNDIYRVLNIDGQIFEDAKGESDSLAGFLLEQAEKIPQKNEKVKFHNYVFTIEAADRRRIKQIKVTILKESSKMQKKSYLNLFIPFLLILSSCTQEYTPKPRTYYRIDLPEHSYQTYTADCPFTFEYSKYALISSKSVRQKNNCWFNLHYPKHKATVHFSYLPIINDTLRSYLEQSRALAMEHISKADDIVENHIFDTTEHVFGTVYDFEGSTATNYQFYLTDSTNHFFRGAMYFMSSPNPDSILPVEEYIKKDLAHMLQTFRWK